MASPEYQLQKTCITWFRFQYPRLRMALFAIPNSNDMSALNRSKAAQVMGKLKCSGLVPGVADLFFAVPSSGRHGLFIEMKAPRGRQSVSQKEFEKAALQNGYGYTIVDNFEQFQETIEEYLEND